MRSNLVLNRCKPKVSLVIPSIGEVITRYNYLKIGTGFFLIKKYEWYCGMRKCSVNYQVHAFSHLIKKSHMSSTFFIIRDEFVNFLS